MSHEGLKILAFADRTPRINIQEVLANEQIDLVVTLGDLERSDLLPLADITIPKIGVYGNHCSGNYMEEIGIMNMHMATWTLKE